MVNQQNTMYTPAKTISQEPTGWIHYYDPKDVEEELD